MYVCNIVNQHPANSRLYVCNIANQQPRACPRETLSVEMKQISIHVLPSYKGDNCFIIPNYKTAMTSQMDNITCEGDMTEFYPARDVISANEISNIAYDY